MQERNGLYKVGVAMACKRLKLPYILFFDGDYIFEHDFEGDPITGILRWRAAQMAQYTMKAANCIICVSETAKTRLETVWQVPEEKIIVFPNGVDVKLYRPYPESRAEVRDSFGIGNNPLIIFVGNFFPWQDLALLLRAFAQILTDYPGAFLLMVGDGKQYNAMVQYAIDLGIDKSVKFTGFLPHSEIPHLISAADLAVAPYSKLKNELFIGSSMKIFEYMACGKAVIASNLGQIFEVIQDGVNGLLVPAGEISALATAMKELISNPDLRSRLSKQARKDAEAEYSWDKYFSRLERVYDALINRQPINLL